MSSSNTRLVSGVAHLFKNEQFSDLKVKCEDEEIPAHKLVICTPSDVLYAMCTAGFQESESNIIDLSHDTKRIVFRMVEFVYRGDYDVLNYPDYPTTDKDTPDGSKVRHAVLHADMFTVADKYDIVALGEKAKEHFEETIDSWSLDDSEFLEVTKYVYSTTPESDRGLRDAIVRETRLRGSQIIKDTGLKPRLEELVSTTPHFAWDLFHNSLQENSVGKESNPNGETSQAESETFGLFD